MDDFIMHFIKVCIAFACIELLFMGHRIYKNEVQRKRLLDELEAERVELQERKATYEAWKKLMEASIERMEQLNEK